jgi:hypothetical protein
MPIHKPYNLIFPPLFDSTGYVAGIAFPNGHHIMHLSTSMSGAGATSVREFRPYREKGNTLIIIKRCLAIDSVSAESQATST